MGLACRNFKLVNCLRIIYFKHHRDKSVTRMFPEHRFMLEYSWCDMRTSISLLSNTAFTVNLVFSDSISALNLKIGNNLCEY